MRKSSAVVPKDFGTRVASFLRRTHPHKTAQSVAAETGCREDAISKWLEGVCAPNGVAVMRLFLVYGPAFVIAVIDDPPAWLDERQRAVRRIELEAGIAQQQAELAHLGSEVRL